MRHRYSVRGSHRTGLIRAAEIVEFLRDRSKAHASEAKSPVVADIFRQNADVLDVAAQAIRDEAGLR